MLMGVETEYGILGGWSLAKAEAIQREALKGRRYLDARKVGVFLDNGARIYVDNGKQNEYATPEAETPSELVTCELAGRRLMSAAARAAGCALICTQVDPVLGTSWGSHENYECARPAGEFPLAWLYPHLVTRLAYAGGGGAVAEEDGVRVVLSARAGVISSSFSVQGVARKALVFAKPEQYCAGARLHLMCGESLLSHAASYLKYAATALVVRCLDMGVRVGPGPFADAPVRALCAVNRDLSLCARLTLLDGRRLTALEVQACYLDDVARCLDRLPDWAPLAVARWRRALDELAAGDRACAQRYDWLLYREYVDALAAACGRGSAAESRGRLLAAAQTLYVKLHVLGDESLYERLGGGAGAPHRLEEVSDAAVAHAVDEPPPGRAANRAALVRKYHLSSACEASWDSVLDLLRSRRLAISREPGWSEPSGWQEVVLSFDQASKAHARAFRRGDFAAVVRLLEPQFASNNARACADACSDLCLSYARLGHMDRARAAVAAADERLFNSRYERVMLELFCATNYGLCAPLHEMERLVQACERLAGERAPAERLSELDAFVFEQNRVVLLLLRGCAAEAERACRRLLAVAANAARARMSSRTRCQLAAALDAQGRRAEAQRELANAIEVQACERLWWDLATFGLPLQARMAESADEARAALTQAEATLRRIRNPLGLAKVLCLKARRLGDGAVRDEFARLCAETSALRACPKAAQVLSRWEEWVAGRPDASAPGCYWGL